MDSTSAINSATDPTAGTSSSTSSAVTSSTASVDQNQFLQILVAQLQDQNPLDPMDGTQFVSQLAQFSSLQELVSIQSTLQSGFGSLTGSTTDPTGSTSNSQTAGV